MKQGQYPISRNPPNELTTAPEPDNIKNSVYLSADIPYENEITLENTQLVDNDEDIESHHFEGVNFDDSHEQSNNKSLFKNNIGNSKQSIKRGTQDVILT